MDGSFWIFYADIIYSSSFYNLFLFYSNILFFRIIKSFGSPILYLL